MGVGADCKVTTSPIWVMTLYDGKYSIKKINKEPVSAICKVASLNR